MSKVSTSSTCVLAVHFVMLLLLAVSPDKSLVSLSHDEKQQD